MTSRSAALFLDRDGVINVDNGYVHRVEDFVWVPGVFDLAREAAALHLKIIVVTNQAGIGRGLYSEDQYRQLTIWMSKCFSAQHAPLAAVYHCPFHADALAPYDVADHGDRKPNPGMLLRAADDHCLDLTRSLMIGDRPSDIIAACRAGLANYALFGVTQTPPPGAAALRDHRASLAWIRACMVALPA